MADKYDVEADSWYVWSKHVLLQLEQDSLYLYDIKKKLTEIEKEIAALKVKSGIWGAIGGAIPACVVIVLWMLKQN